MRKLLALAVGLGLLTLPGFSVLPAKAQSVEPPHTRGAGSPYQTLKRKKQKTTAATQQTGKRKKTKK
jgi:hypothetical protein